MNLFAGGVVEAVGKIADELFTSDKERLDAEIEFRKVDASLSIAQTEVNKAEAGHASVFVAGWRPAVGWCGAAAMAYQFLIYPLMVWAWNLAQALGWLPAGLSAPPMLDTDALWVILSGMLGIAGARTFEKVKGVAR
jgi:hypothetical protein